MFLLSCYSQGLPIGDSAGFVKEIWIVSLLFWSFTYLLFESTIFVVVESGFFAM